MQPNRVTFQLGRMACLVRSLRNAGLAICRALLLVIVVQASAEAESAYKVSWSAQLGDGGFDRADDVAADRAGNLYVCGWNISLFGETDSCGREGFLVKYDARGLRLWERQFRLSGEDRSSDSASTRSAGSVRSSSDRSSRNRTCDGSGSAERSA